MLVQGSAEWKEWRLNGIGSSDASAVMGESPWKTPYQLWELKTRRAEERVANGAMKRGIGLEPKARAVYERMVGFGISPDTRVHSDLDYIRASFDGLKLDKDLVLEIKAPNQATHAMAVAGKVPEHYMWQLAHQMLVANVSTAHYFSFDGENGVIVEVKRNEQIEVNLLTKEKAFWDLVKKDEAPEFSDRDYELITDPTAMAYASVYKDLDAEIKRLEEKKTEARDILVDYAAGERIICGGVMIYSAMRKGNVNYKSIPELKGVDLEKYRGKSSSVTTVRVK